MAIKKPQNVYLPTDKFLAEVTERSEGDERSQWVTQFAIHLAKGYGKDAFAKELLDAASEDMRKNRVKQNRSRAKQSLVNEGVKNPTLQQIDNRYKELFGNKDLNDQEAAQASTNAGEASSREAEDESATVSDSPAVQITPGILAAISDREGQQKRTEEGMNAPVFSPSSKPSSVRNVQLPKTKQEVIEFALDNGLDVDDASEWAEINLKERKGRDKDGRKIANWRGALVNYCKAMERKRKNES